MQDLQKGKYFRDLKNLEVFRAQLDLESELYSSLAERLLTLKMDNPSFNLEYARVRGGLDVLRQIAKLRDNLSKSASSDNPGRKI